MRISIIQCISSGFYLQTWSGFWHGLHIFYNEKVTKLKELWGKGNTASQIAEIIGGISRNAVIGKAHRLNLSAKIKTRAATSNRNFENSFDGNNTQYKRGRKSKFKSLIIEKNF